MPLPLCVKVDDLDAHHALICDGWRAVGELLTYAGAVDLKPILNIRRVNEFPTKLWSQIEWTGRLARDVAVGEVPTPQIEDGQRCYVYGSFPSAFLLHEDIRVVLVGVHPCARGLGLAAKMIQMIMPGMVVAGTYSGNESAIRLYRSLGMEQISSQWVLHKYED